MLVASIIMRMVFVFLDAMSMNNPAMGCFWLLFAIYLKMTEPSE
jgi:hypothetical protein